jgi:hypothetical protein
MNLTFATWNILSGAADGYGHSGIAAAGHHGGGYGSGYADLVRAMADRTPWPDIFIMGVSGRRAPCGTSELPFRIAGMPVTGLPACQPLRSQTGGCQR